MDRYNEVYVPRADPALAYRPSRYESVPGLFAEYSYNSPDERLAVVTGLRS
ncbi:MAG: hypothetical protein HC880_16865, partial [Bacteroidia bacterium]|nr:hypothetical protein [Bacteroidia bacterium]